jgi:hypothetical protein
MTNTDLKVKKIIDSCTNQHHIESCKRMIKNHPDEILYKDFIKKREYVLKEYNGLVEGSVVMVISNENTPVWKGKIISFYDNDCKWTNPFPIIIKEENNKEYMCMGIVLPYTEEGLNRLNNLEYKERWNSVCRKHCMILD